MSSKGESNKIDNAMDEKRYRVIAVHDLHVWPMSTTETALTAHLVRSVDRCDSFLLEKCCRELHDKFEIQHATIQFETEDHDCELAPEGKV